MKKSKGTQEVKQFYNQDDIVQQKFLIDDDYEQWVVVEHNNETLSMSLYNWQKLVEFANIIISKHNTDEQDETEHLLSTETNKRRLLESIKQQEIMKQTAVEWLHEILATSELEDMEKNTNLWFKQAKELEEKQRDEFAIGFAEWCLKIRFEPIKNISVEKLLEIYKKEKGL